MRKLALLLLAFVCITPLIAQNAQPTYPVTPNTITAPQFYLQSRVAGPWLSYFNDFLSSADVGSGPVGSPTGNSCAGNATNEDINHPGNIGLISGTGGSATGDYCFINDSSTYPFVSINTAPTWVWETAINIPVLPGTTAGTYQVGMVHTSNVSPWTTGVAFEISSANANANHFYCEIQSTLTDTGVSAVANTWYRLTMWNDGTNVHWAINGTEATGCATAISNLPSTTQFMWTASSVAGSSTSVTVYFDYALFQRQLTR